MAHPAPALPDPLDQAKAVLDGYAWGHQGEWSRRDYEECVRSLTRALEDLIDLVEQRA